MADSRLSWPPTLATSPGCTATCSSGTTGWARSRAVASENSTRSSARLVESLTVCFLCIHRRHGSLVLPSLPLPPPPPPPPPPPRAMTVFTAATQGRRRWRWTCAATAAVVGTWFCRTRHSRSWPPPERGLTRPDGASAGPCQRFVRPEAAPGRGRSLPPLGMAGVYRCDENVLFCFRGVIAE